MALILKGGAIFLHIPKTGGSWVTRVLRECDLLSGKIGHKHADIARLFSPIGNNNFRIIKYYLRKWLRIYPRNPYLFTFVRHPLSWYESFFRYMSQSDQNWRHWGDLRSLEQWHPNAPLNGLGDRDFNRFMRNVIQKHPGYVTEMYGWYSHPHVDFIGKQENLRLDLITVLHQLNMDFDEEMIRNYRQVNQSATPRQVIQWDPGLKKEVMQIEHIGITRYGYDSLDDEGDNA